MIRHDLPQVTEDSQRLGALQYSEQLMEKPQRIWLMVMMTLCGN